jgi:hypothetical protein
VTIRQGDFEEKRRKEKGQGAKEKRASIHGEIRRRGAKHTSATTN